MGHKHCREQSTGIDDDLCASMTMSPGRARRQARVARKLPQRWKLQSSTMPVDLAIAPPNRLKTMSF